MINKHNFMHAKSIQDFPINANSNKGKRPKGSMSVTNSDIVKILRGQFLEPQERSILQGRNKTEM